MPDVQEEIQALRRELEPLLHKGLLERLKYADWYVTGLSVGIESLQRFLEIAALAYRETAADSDGGRRVARLKLVCTSLQRFADGGSLEERAETLLTLRVPLTSLVRDLRLADDGPRRRRNRFIAQLAADVHVAVRRVRTLEQLKADLGIFEGFLSRTFGGKKRIDEFVDRYRPFARKLGFEDTAVLERPDGARAVGASATREIGVVQRHLQQLHARIYSGRFRDFSKGDVDSDLEETTLMQLLTKMAKDGHDYLTRAAGIYGHALELIGRGTDLLAREEQIAAFLDGDAPLPVRDAPSTEAPAADATAFRAPPGTSPPLAADPDSAFAAPGGFLGADDEDADGADPPPVVGTMLLDEEVAPPAPPAPAEQPAPRAMAAERATAPAADSWAALAAGEAEWSEPSVVPPPAAQPRWMSAVQAALADEMGTAPPAPAPDAAYTAPSDIHIGDAREAPVPPLELDADAIVDLPIDALVVDASAPIIVEPAAPEEPDTAEGAAARAEREARNAEDALASLVKLEAVAEAAAVAAEAAQQRAEDELRDAREAAQFSALRAEAADERARAAQEQALAELSEEQRAAASTANTSNARAPDAAAVGERSSSFVTRMSPDELRALAEQLVKAGRLTREDVDSTKK